MSENGDKSLAEKLDIAIESLSSWYRVILVMVIIGLLSLSVVISLSQYYFQQEITKNGHITEIRDEKTGATGLVFVPNSERVFAPESILGLYTTQVWLMASNGLVIGLLSFLFLWITYRGHAYRKELKSIEGQLIRQSYLVNFETSIPEGKDRIERILNHSCLVFPELQTLLRGKSDKKLPAKLNQKVGTDTVDILIPTKKGDFIVKFFDDVSFPILEQFTSNMSKSGKLIFRVLCVAKNYDEDLQSSQLSSLMQKLNLDFDMDLIFEDEQGYSMLWIN
ncbi:MAG: hypothetical protein ACK4TO_06190 [Candidatus Nitrosotenuis sp.]